MKKSAFLILLLARPFIFAQTSDNFYYNYNSIDINNTTLYLNNIGNTYRNLGIGGGFWNKLSSSNNENIVLFEYGISVIGKIDNQLRLGHSGYNSFFAPGPIINGQPAMIYSSDDSLKYRIYKINNGDESSKDFIEWPSEFGAPVDKIGKPKFHGDQMLWTVFNTYDTSALARFRSWNYPPDLLNDILPFPVEIQQLTFAKKNEFPDVIFFEWTIINKGVEEYKDVYFSLFADIDFNNTLANFPAADTNFQLAYSWSNNIAQSIQPAVGFQLISGPIVNSNNSTARFKDQQKIGYKNLNITSIHGIVDDAVPVPPGDLPDKNIMQIWHVANGRETDGSEIINTNTGEETKYYWDGDPVNNSGWNYTHDYENSGGGAGFIISTGPFNIAVNDTQWVMMAFIPSLGNENLDSITEIRKIASRIKEKSYEELIRPSITTGLNNEINKNINDEYKLYQNYPNPFNPKTKFNFFLHEKNIVSIRIFNSLGEIILSLLNKNLESGLHEIEFVADKFPSGIYFYQLTAGNFIETKKMVLLK